MMDLKQVLKSSVLCAALAAAGISTSALAADATLNITGTIKASPCTVVADDASGNVNVKLGDDIQAASLTPQKGSEWKPFDLKLKDCPDTTTAVVAAFTGTPATETGGEDLYKNTGDATKVQIELQNRTAGTRLGNGSNMKVDVVGATNDATFPLQARAYSVEGGVTPGTVVGTVQVAFTYQ
ncbi:minor fimbrial subunit [Serratia fonticola]|uniref:Minor fimbrial subunit n=1 Tax=Serratia fonticola TaxID=47917 RepID=A0A542BTV9_SERFO|nr:fimbrial protein [Serratia fonticola]TQI81985.1 minor fimbrial subunit [Serratia fonticola]TQI95992.1 minor fimbrial subunit [Serratia fonticola]TVZ70489.1 minor fimbrial subunit [Serratia fonticola]